MKKKLLHICNDYRDNNLYERMFTELSINNWEQIVFVPYKAKIELKNKSQYNINQYKCYSNFDRFFYSKKINKIYKTCLEKVDLKNIELIHAHTLFSAGGVAHKLKENNNIDYIVSVRGTDVNIFFEKMIHLRHKGIKILLEAKKIIFISKSIECNLLKLINDKEIKGKIIKKSIVIPNGIDDIWFNNKIKKKSISNTKEINLVQTGWINRNKNQLTTIKAVEELNNLGIQCKLSIIGGIENDKDKYYYKKILNYIENSKHKDKFVFVGRKNKKDIINLYKHENIFVLPSHHETFGLVYVEALTQGLPVIYSKGQGIDGIFEEGTVGYSTDSDNYKDIVNAVKQICEKYDRLQENINEKICLENFKWENICKVIDNIYSHEIKLMEN